MVFSAVGRPSSDKEVIILGFFGDKASEALDRARPRGIVGKAAVAAARGVRAVDRRITADPHNTVGDDPTKCHMRGRRNGKECNNNLNTRAKLEQGHCGHHVCAKEHTEYTLATDESGNPLFNEYMHSTRRVVKRW